MSLRRTSRRHKQEAEDLDVTPLLNLMIILLPVLLAGAAFTHMTVLPVDVPAASQQTDNKATPIQLEIAVMPDSMVVDDGKQVIANIPRGQDGAYDYAQLSAVMQQIKQKHPDHKNVTLLLQDDTKYAVLVHTMDAVRMTRVADPDNADKMLDEPLFPDISLGDAPGAD